MNNLNSILLEGHAHGTDGRDLATGTRYCEFVVESTRFFKGDDGTYEKESSFFTVEAYGRLAKLCGTELVEHRKLRVVGRLKQRRWTDTNGVTLSKVVIIAEHVEIMEKFVEEVLS